MSSSTECFIPKSPHSRSNPEQGIETPSPSLISNFPQPTSRIKNNTSISPTPGLTPSEPDHHFGTVQDCLCCSGLRCGVNIKHNGGVWHIVDSCVDLSDVLDLAESLLSRLPSSSFAFSLSSRDLRTEFQCVHQHHVYPARGRDVPNLASTTRDINTSYYRPRFF